ncbi:MAG: response regulator [Patescibacteria group bacterium]|jgi:DNA-binding response OmpR family regulator|nr:response regulator [Patescibacteria group bacterium]
MSINKKILIVEDDEFLLSMYSTKFEIEGYEVVMASDGEMGVEKAQKEKPGIILLDIMLPNMDGFDVLKKLKADTTTSAIPVILLTNLSQKQDVEQGLSMGADDYLVKAHFMPSEVVDKINRLLGQ